MRKKAVKRLQKLYATLPKEAQTRTNWKQFKRAFNAMSSADKSKKTLRVEKVGK